MTTAASTSGGFQMVAASDAYAIPIGKAVAIAKQIESGKSSSTVHVGDTAFLGVQVTTAGYGDYPGSGDGSSSTGALIAGVVDGGPAATAGLTTGESDHGDQRHDDLVADRRDADRPAAQARSERERHVHRPERNESDGDRHTRQRAAAVTAGHGRNGRCPARSVTQLTAPTPAAHSGRFLTPVSDPGQAPGSPHADG